MSFNPSTIMGRSNNANSRTQCGCPYVRDQVRRIEASIVGDDTWNAAKGAGESLLFAITKNNAESVVSVAAVGRQAFLNIFMHVPCECQNTSTSIASAFFPGVCCANSSTAWRERSRCRKHDRNKSVLVNSKVATEGTWTRKRSQNGSISMRTHLRHQNFHVTSPVHDPRILDSLHSRIFF